MPRRKKSAAEPEASANAVTSDIVERARERAARARLIREHVVLDRNIAAFRTAATVALATRRRARQSASKLTGGSQ